ncbi:hypothetical protein CMV_003035 [Castanea mollissima]|uniref:Uncharacterized protein n=1 Tax=Castanea mollissima TaxID=60419 RepID=A0A8J4VX07_9ROSI|nr:hypothetical protein CMV_003035 [Castanea mollissima]
MHPSSVPMDENYNNQVFHSLSMPMTSSSNHFQLSNQIHFSYWSGASPNVSLTSMLQSNDCLNHLSQVSSGFQQPKHFSKPAYKAEKYSTR